MTFLISAALLVSGADAFGQDLSAGNVAAGTTGAQQATSCAKPRLGGLPKQPKFTNATIHYKLTNLTVGSTYLMKVAKGEVAAGPAQQSTVKGTFLLPDQGVKDKKIVISAIVQNDNCENAPWKLQRKIRYNAVTPPAAKPTPPATPAPAAVAPAKPATPLPAPSPVKPANPVKPVKPVQPVTKRIPVTTPSNQRTWLNPLDAGSRLEQAVSEPRLSRLERKTDKANSGNALLGLGIVFSLFSVGAVGALWVFRKRDDMQFEQAMTEQLKHLEEGGPDLTTADDESPDAPVTASPAPFSEEAVAAEAPTEPVVAAAPPAPITAAAPPTPVTPEHRAEVERELQRLLNEAGLEAHLDGILADARSEAERHGVELDTDLMLQALCDEINGDAKLSDGTRSELRSMFADIIAEEARRLPAPEPERVATP